MDTVNYVHHELEKTGYYDVQKQPQVHLWSKTEQNLTVNGAAINARPMAYSPSVQVKADLTLASNDGCDADDYSSNMAGNIALIKRGSCSLAQKSVLAASAGADAAIVYNNVDGPFSGTLGGPTSDLGPYAPIVGISMADGEDLIKQMSGNLNLAEALSADLYINSEMENRTTYNIIAQTKESDSDNVVTIGSHSDSVEAGPGINDNGSGTISNLAVARALTNFSVNNAVRFAFWTAEEFGLLGSKHYIDSLDEEELDKIRLYLDFDMIASPNYALMIHDGDGSALNVTGPEGSGEIKHMFEEYFDSQDLPHIPAAFDGRSDYAAFIDKGIPAGGVATGAEGIKSEEEAQMFGGEPRIAYDANYHGAGDTTDNLNHEAFLINSKAAAYAVGKYADSLESIPVREKTTAVPKRTVHKQGSGNGKTGCFHSLVSE